MVENVKEKVGSVLVVGGGIGGMQASLDLAESGFKVYLIDKKPSIGGVMAQLDKTFPTNDCSMCIVSPRLVEVDRHLNIDCITLADVTKVEGEAGNFTVHISKKARFIDLDLCTGCGDCESVCPVTLGNEFELGMKDRKAIFKLYPQAVPSAYAITKTGISPCKITCPSGVNAHGYIELVRVGKYAEALKLVKERNPFPAICGRVCTHPCESKCNRGKVDEPVAINAIKRFIADREIDQPFTGLPEDVIPIHKNVGVVGAGPAGLTASQDLAFKGYNVTVFDEMPEGGGMMFSCIPSYRLPRDVIATEVKAIEALGVNIKYNTKVGKDIEFHELLDKFDALFIAIGAHKGLKLNIPGEDEFQGFQDCVAFLKDVNLGKDVKAEEKVIVIGGGNAALDAARTSMRLGSKEVTVIYRRSREEMPANSWEIDDAVEEGINILYLTAPLKVIGDNGKVKGIECIKTELGEPDSSGRRRPLHIEGSNFILEADLIIPAISQEPDLGFLPQNNGLKISRRNSFEVDKVTMQTSISKVFAGGDAVTGPRTIIEAIAAGHEAAISIDRFLKGEDLRERRGDKEILEAISPVAFDEVRSIPRAVIPKLHLDMRRSFDEVELGLSEEQVLNEAARCLDCGICCECGECVRICQAGAVKHDMISEIEEQLHVGAIILAPGFDLFKPELKEEYGYKRYKNIITSLEFERMLSASGYSAGKIQRPSDGITPQKIAFIQCLGSRDKERPYCSSVCCMYATKEAIIAKEHEKDLDCHIYFIDLRAFGKGYEEYYNRAKQIGIKFTRCIPSSIKEVPQNKNLKFQYLSESGELKFEEFDLVVLSCGLTPPENTKEISEKFGIELNNHSFCKTDPFSPTETSRKGIYACGTFTEPKDIPETVIQSSGSAANAMTLLSSVRGKLISKKDYPPERDFSKGEIHLGVFICHCGKNIGGVLNMNDLVDFTKDLENVVYVEDKLYSCSQDSQEGIKEAILENGLNRVVVAACTPRTHESLFQETMKEVGLNPYLMEFASIRDQCSWVHMKEKDRATEKAKLLIHMAVNRAKFLQPLYKKRIDISKEVLVIGGGIAGMNCSLNLADQGYKVHLIEKSGELGGMIKNIKVPLNGAYPELFLKKIVYRVEGNKKIHVYLNSELRDFSGFVGNFEAEINGNDKDNQRVKCGVVIVATGAKEFIPVEYLYGVDERVNTQLELENLIVTQSENFKSMNEIVMIQCVGSRCEERQYCSRICCTVAIKNALAIKKLNAEINIYILYRDIRTYGFKEDIYKEAREKGIIFIRFEDNKKPIVKNDDNKLMVEVIDGILKQSIMLNPDLLVLSVASVPNDDAEKLSSLLKVPLTEDNLFLEAHMKLRPVDFANDGIFLCGTAHYPKFIDETISQSNAAAARASTILFNDQLWIGGVVASVDELNCIACLTCVRTCAYGIPCIEEGIARIDPVLCRGCGSCTGVCPARAIQLMNYTDLQIEAKENALFLVQDEKS